MEKRRIFLQNSSRHIICLITLGSTSMLLILLIRSMKQIARIHRKATSTYMVTSRYLKFSKVLAKTSLEAPLMHGLNL